MERPIRRRRRPARSCLECRRRKVKCDRNEPCNHCVASDARCTYRLFNDDRPVVTPRTHVPHPEPAALTTPSPSIVVDLDSQGSASGTTTNEQQQQPPSSSGSRTPSQVASKNDNVTPNNDDGEVDGILGLWRRLQMTEDVKDGADLGLPGGALVGRGRDVTRRTTATTTTPGGLSNNNGGDMLAQQYEPKDSQVLLNKTRMLTWSHWLGTAPEFNTIIACFASASGKDKVAPFDNGGRETNHLVDEMGHLIRSCKANAKQIKMWRPSKHLDHHQNQQPHSSLPIPPRETADHMVDLYFASFESTQRILHIPSFWVEYNKFWEEQQQQQDTNHQAQTPINIRLKVLLVIATGSSLESPQNLDERFPGWVQQWVHAAQMWLSGPLEKDRLDLHGIQVHCLVILARQIFSIGGDLLWISIGSLTYMAMQMGLHRDPKHLQAMSVLQTELRRRLWATVLEFVVQSSLDSAMPPRISWDEFDTEAPSNFNDDDLVVLNGAFSSSSTPWAATNNTNTTSTATPSPHPRTTLTSTSLQLLLYSSLPLRLRIVRLLNGLRPELSYLDILSLSAELTDSHRQCNHFIQQHEHASSSSFSGVRITPFHKGLLRLLTHRFLIPLHCPFGIQSRPRDPSMSTSTPANRPNPLYTHSHQALLTTALDLFPLSPSSPLSSQEFSNLLTLAGSLFRESIRYVLGIVSLELLSHAEERHRHRHRKSSSSGTSSSSDMHLDILRSATADLTTLSLERIKRAKGGGGAGGETNVKGYMFLEMIRAQVDALEKGREEQGMVREEEGGEEEEVAREVARAGRDALRVCEGILVGRKEDGEKILLGVRGRGSNGGEMPNGVGIAGDIPGILEGLGEEDDDDVAGVFECDGSGGGGLGGFDDDLMDFDFFQMPPPPANDGYNMVFM